MLLLRPLHWDAIVPSREGAAYLTLSRAARSCRRKPPTRRAHCTHTHSITALYRGSLARYHLVQIAFTRFRGGGREIAAWRGKLIREKRLYVLSRCRVYISSVQLVQREDYGAEVKGQEDGCARRSTSHMEISFVCIWHHCNEGEHDLHGRLNRTSADSLVQAISSAQDDLNDRDTDRFDESVGLGRRPPLVSRISFLSKVDAVLLLWGIPILEAPFEGFPFLFAISLFWGRFMIFTINGRNNADGSLEPLPPPRVDVGRETLAGLELVGKLGSSAQLAVFFCFNPSSFASLARVFLLAGLFLVCEAGQGALFSRGHSAQSNGNIVPLGFVLKRLKGCCRVRHIQNRGNIAGKASLTLPLSNRVGPELRERAEYTRFRPIMSGSERERERSQLFLVPRVCHPANYAGPFEAGAENASEGRGGGGLTAWKWRPSLQPSSMCKTEGDARLSFNGRFRTDVVKEEKETVKQVSGSSPRSARGETAIDRRRVFQHDAGLPKDQLSP
ncbi:hypothetical protein CCUS01_01001 [Colletotrichum cuscutae]|uniref:Uncharacterized protein n=1 Tax=Colletotrichum cuscutae TaxID=1209917 RepID=A0AAI9V4Y7_9PEZI|nr:hypothetical protein CCUS01_01001 [Colletotrichum cuscutae]